MIAYNLLILQHWRPNLGTAENRRIDNWRIN